LRDDKTMEVVYDNTPNGAPNLFGFASRAWLEGLLNPENYSKISYGEPMPSNDRDLAKLADHPDNHKRAITAPYFGNTAHRTGRMAEWLNKHAKSINEQDRSDIAAALSAQARLRSQAEADQTDSQRIARGI